MKRLYVDMDGTIAKWDSAKSIEEVASPGYFRNCEPMQNVIDAVKLIQQNCPFLDIYILSATFQDGHSKDDKNAWLDQYLPEIPQDHRIFATYGESKDKYVVNKGDILIDDYSKNLHEWEAAGGKGIKVLNGINWNQKTWKGDIILHDATPELLASTIPLLGLREEYSVELVKAKFQERAEKSPQGNIPAWEPPTSGEKNRTQARSLESLSTNRD